MSTKVWTKDPDETADYTIDWASELTGDTITSSTWVNISAGIVTGTPASTHTDTTATIWISGGVIGQVYNLTNRVTTSGGRTYDQDVQLRVPAPATFLPYDGCLWPIDPGCLGDTWDDYSPQVQQRALMLASASMTKLTAGRVGDCPIKVRPDVRGGHCGFIGGAPWTWGSTFYGAPHIGDYGSRTHDPRDIELPGPVNRIDEVMIDGVVIDPADYRISHRASGRIRYLGDDFTGWPVTQDWNVEADEVGAFTVTYLNTAPVDGQGAHAAGLLAAEFAKVCASSDGKAKCKFPSNITSIVRQGLTIEFVAGSFPNGMTGIREVDLYTAQWNVKGRGAATLLDPGAPRHEVVTR